MTKTIVVLFGPPGSGKTTLAPMVAKACGVPDVRIADLIKRKIETGTEEGDHIAEVLSEGRTLSDPIVLGLLKEKILEDDCSKGFLLSDFPATLAQGQTFDHYLVKNDLKAKFKILELYAPDTICNPRLLVRWIHEPSGRVYSSNAIGRPKSLAEGAEATEETMLDDVTGDVLLRMQKDTVYEIPKQLFVYHLGAEPVLEHFGRQYYSRIDVSGSDLNKIVDDCMAYLNRTIFYVAPIAEALAAAPLPEKSDCLAAETRVYARGDLLERRVWEPPARRAGAGAELGGTFNQTRWRGADH